MRRFSAHLGYLFNDRPLAERFAAAKAAGFDAVEHPAPYGAPAADVAQWLADTGVPFAQMALAAGDATRGEKGLAALPDRVAAFRDSIAPGLDYAEAIGCKAVHAMSGVRPQGIDPARLWETYLENMGIAADAAAKRGMILLIEPIGAGTLPDYFMDRPDLAVEAVAALGRANVRLLFDAFHAANAGVDPVGFVAAHADLIHHVHIADLPGRHEPGTGTIDFRGLYVALDKAGNEALIGCEYIPAGRTEEGLGWMAQHRAF